MNDNSRAQPIEFISVKHLIQLRNCSKSLYYNQLALDYPGFERKSFMKEVLKEVKTMLVDKKSRNVIEHRVLSMYEDSFLRDWFEFDAQYQQARMNDT